MEEGINEVLKEAPENEAGGLQRLQIMRRLDFRITTSLEDRLHFSCSICKREVK